MTPISWTKPYNSSNSSDNRKLSENTHRIFEADWNVEATPYDRWAGGTSHDWYLDKTLHVNKDSIEKYHRVLCKENGDRRVSCSYKEIDVNDQLFMFVVRQEPGAVKSTTDIGYAKHTESPGERVMPKRRRTQKTTIEDAT
ncbi:TPA: hypothetical protein HA251_01950 [Candidatus Woesearchaeota archaeon]|nr:hypothetical protein [Candidatus Woesearchaeota archaeon]